MQNPFKKLPLKKAWFYIKYSILLLFQVALLSVIIYRVVPVPITWTVVERWNGLDKDWIPYEKISKNVVIAAMTSEDPNFNTHWGFEFKAIKEAYEDNYDDDNKTKKLKGGSTISQQTAKNVFLYQGWGITRYIRKAFEIPFTVLIEVMWTKRRIMEVYLNIIEMGPGIYGIEAASQHYYRKPASKLTVAESASIVVCFPSPLKRKPTALSPRLQRKRDRIARWMVGYKLPPNLEP
ncbi:MAG TPA: monofunctional biosynthetic peptidoglycan transglycosylase [Bacteroidia bacterium]|nr:monofunctional biosynthetic peptidoglycan transglycosylase [Bacteroidia bacterium]